MKIKLLALCISFGAFAETVEDKYMLSLPNKLYKNSIVVVQSNGGEIEQPTETVSPICGLSNNGSFNTTPSQLCNVGAASSVIENTNSYLWACSNDNITVNCSATRIQLPVCGSANGIAIDLKPTENLCEKGTPSSVITANGNHTWTCESSGETESCSANQIINTAKHSSCKAMLNEYPQLAGQNGVYSATVGGLNSSLYCNMTYQGGGWTLVVAQFETDPVTNWNEGIQSDYDPSLLTKKGFALNALQLPSNNQVAFTQSDFDSFSISMHFNYTYTTGNISKNTILGSNGLQYEIHRSTTGHYSNHSPEGNSLSNTNNIYHNTLTVDQIGGVFFSYSFSPMFVSDSKVRGFGYKGNRTSISDEGAWLVWVR